MNTWIQQWMNEVLPWVNDNNKIPWVILADVTSRDWLQSLPWWNYWTKEQRWELSKLLSDFWMHHIELWFPSMKWDPEYEAVKYAANEVGERESVVMWLARLVESDIANTINALDWAKYKWVHTFIGTSPEHLSTFSFWTDDILKNITARVSQIREAWYIAQFSAEDATRTDHDFLIEVYEKALAAGAQILNIPDTAWVYDSQQYNNLMQHMYSRFPNTVISTHTHNDKSQAEQSALITASNWFAQRIEWTVFWIWERAWNADVMILVSVIMQDPAYSHLSKELLKNPEKFIEILEYMTEISWIHARPVSPWYWHEAIVNRSWVHQAKMAKLKESYVAYPWTIFWLDNRPEIEISALSGKGWVIAIYENFWIKLNNEQSTVLTKVLRQILSPDTNPHEIHAICPKLSEDFLYQLWLSINIIRTEARTLKNTKENLIKWNEETDSIIKKIYEELYWE